MIFLLEACRRRYVYVYDVMSMFTMLCLCLRCYVYVYNVVSMFTTLCQRLRLRCLWVFMLLIGKRYDYCVRRLMLWLFCLWMIVALRLRANRLAHSTVLWGVTEIYFVLWPFLLSMVTYIYFPWSWDRQGCSSVWLWLSSVVLFVSFTLYGLKCVIVCHNYIHCCAVYTVSIYVCMSWCALWLRWGVTAPSQDYGGSVWLLVVAPDYFILFSVCWV